MHPHQSDHDHSPPAGEAPGYYEIMETAVRELLVERGMIDPGEIRRQIEVLDSRTPALGAKVVARMGRSELPGAASGQRALGLRGARHQLLRRHAADRPREHPDGAQFHRLHAVFVLPAGQCSVCRPTGTS
jgi:hypothetical protein